MIPIKIGRKSLSAASNEAISAVTFQYAYPNITQATINTNIEITGFFIFTFSFFFVAFKRLISLYLEIFIVLNTITAKYITAKYIQVFMHAS